MLKGIFGKIMARGSWTMATNVPPPPVDGGSGTWTAYPKLSGQVPTITVTMSGSGGGGMSNARNHHPMTQAEVDALIQQKAMEENHRREIAQQRAINDGASGIWGVNNAPRCHTCPLYSPAWGGEEGVCIKGGAGVTRPRESCGCETHPEIQAVMRLRIEQATVEFVARKITGGE